MGKEGRERGGKGGGGWESQGKEWTGREGRGEGRRKGEKDGEGPDQVSREIDAPEPNDSRFWQYTLYADIRGGSQDLCKFSLHLRLPVSIYQKERYGIPYSF